MPSAQALMTKHVSVSEQGQLQGANASLMSLSGILGPLLFTQTFAATLDRMPGAAFMLAGLLLLAAMAVAWRATRVRAVV
jgi:DHA1 family tetracycline resistance protein-like MFS transporter